MARVMVLGDQQAGRSTLTRTLAANHIGRSRVHRSVCVYFVVENGTSIHLQANDLKVPKQRQLDKTSALILVCQER